MGGKHTQNESQRHVRHKDKELQKSQSELERAADSLQRDKNKQGGQHGEGQGKTGDQRR